MAIAIASATKTNFTNACTNIQSTIQTLGTQWATLVAAQQACSQAQGRANSSNGMENIASTTHLARMVVALMRANGLDVLLSQSDVSASRADIIAMMTAIMNGF